MKTQLEKQISETVEILKVDNNSVDFKTLDGTQYWAKLTATGKVKNNSVRLATW